MIELDLHRHCIETEMKRLHNRYISMLLKPGADPVDTENKLQVLRNVLERLDFSSLRADFPELAGYHQADIKLSLDKEDRMELIIDGIRISLHGYCKA